jgi:serine/threonine-protein kinase
MTGSGNRQDPDQRLGEPLAHPEAPVPGSVIAGKYRVEGIVGAGGMGVVVVAYHVALAQRVAIKFMLRQAASDENAVGRFLREARAAAALSNEHVTRVLDVGTLENGAPYMVMEFLAGFDMSEALRRDGPMSIGAAVDIVLQACEALAEAHARGIVHRDLKPANLFATTRPDGSRLIKVLDFGISKAVDPINAATSQNLTATGVVMGSPAYMSPEQVRSSRDVDPRTDIWSLGVILYELLTGVSPFEGETMGATLAMIVADDPPPIAARRRDLPPDLVATITRCLARRVNERVKNVGELASSLLPFAEAEGALSVKRILRMSGVSNSGTIAVPAEVSFQRTSQAPSPTASAWLRSGAVPGVPTRSRARVGVIAAALLGTAIAVGFFALHRPGARVEPAATAAPPTQPLSAAASDHAAQEPAAATGATAPSAASPAPHDDDRLIPLPQATPAPPTAAAPRAAQPGSTPNGAGAPVGTAGPAGRAPPAVSPAPAGRNRPRGAADCDPPFTIDSAGYRVPKPECL